MRKDSASGRKSVRAGGVRLEIVDSLRAPATRVPPTTVRGVRGN
jgi:hypothetical protein